jgi:small subunit ribosomal protein S4
VRPLPGVTGENLLVRLETRLDSVVHRMGFAQSRRAARQLVRHRHIEVNGRTVDVPSFQVRPGDEVKVTQTSRDLGSLWIRTRRSASSSSCRRVTRSRLRHRNR